MLFDGCTWEDDKTERPRNETANNTGALYRTTFLLGEAATF